MYFWRSCPQYLCKALRHSSLHCTGHSLRSPPNWVFRAQRAATFRTAATPAYPRTPEGHPLLDVSHLLNGAEGHAKQRAATLRSLEAALREVGYFYAQNVSVLSADYLSKVYEYSKQLHALPIGVKSAFAPEDSHGAYSGPDVGKAELEYEPGSVSTVRAWDYSRNRFTLSSGELDGNRFPGASIIEPPFVEFLDDLYERQNVLARGLMVAFADMLDLPSHTFLDMFEGRNGQGDFGTIRLLSYPANPSLTEEEARAATAGISPHTDFEAFTLMHQDAPGLQFIPASRTGIDDAWLDAPVRPGEFVVILGDVMERFTNGDLKATPHRVVITPHPRSSIIRFNAVSADTMIAPLPKFVSSTRPAKYSRVTMQTHMETTMQNLKAGLGAWDAVAGQSTTANYLYIDGVDHRKVS
eukprot:TRINITY_DN102322_c0_g1_i1.p1 TRINITY_DN102322_c0_g1~~TRINITY_DN102322_c0_g1_i1.p1  ORF type:complete len:425 (-),score=38.00 TRINITY_DN102322_c0_g1_i1:306-1541(-)